MAEEKYLYYVPYSYEDPSASIRGTLNGFVFYEKPLETADDIYELRQNLTTDRRQNVVLLPWKRIQ